MLTAKVRCIVIRVPAEQNLKESSSYRLRQDALPWADPYILGLIAKLQQEVREERAAQAQARREAEANADEARETFVEEVLAGDVPPPFSTSIGLEFADEDDFEDWCSAQRLSHRPR